MHILTLDAHTRTWLFALGALASYLLGANNIANVMGMFVPAVPFGDVSVAGLMTLSGTRFLFLLGGIAIAVGILTFGENVMSTVGHDLFRITPLAGLVVVFAEVLVLFLFTSESLESLLLQAGLPTIPLAPLSATQVVIGAVIGVGLAKGGKGLRYHVLGRIAGGWLFAPVVAGVFCFIALFIAQNVFQLEVVRSSSYPTLVGKTNGASVRLRRSGYSGRRLNHSPVATGAAPACAGAISGHHPAAGIDVPAQVGAGPGVGPRRQQLARAARAELPETDRGAPSASGQTAYPFSCPNGQPAPIVRRHAGSYNTKDPYRCAVRVFPCFIPSRVRRRLQLFCHTPWPQRCP